MRVIVVRQGNRYGPEYVRALQKQVKETTPHAQFLCLSDQQDNGCLTVHMQTDYKGWWSKLELFSPALQDLRPFLYLDLDTFVMDDLTECFTVPTQFTMLRDFYRPEGGQSAMMYIPKDVDHIWNKWIKRPDYWQLRHYAGGDQAYLERFTFTRFQDILQGHKSYKADDLADMPGEGTVTVHFHGKPKPPETTGWAKQFWSYYAT